MVQCLSDELHCNEVKRCCNGRREHCNILVDTLLWTAHHISMVGTTSVATKPHVLYCVSNNTSASTHPLAQVNFFFFLFSVHAHPHLHHMHSCVPLFTNHLHFPQHICIHTFTGTSKFFLLSFLSVHSSTSTPHAHTTCTPVCGCSPTIYISPSKHSSELFPGESILFSHKLGVFWHILIYLQVFVSCS